MRIIANAEFRANTAPIFKDLKVLNLSKLHTYFVQLFVYNYNHNLLPEIFNNFYVQNSTVHSHFTRQANNLHVPISQCSQAYRDVRCFGVKTFNYFLPHIRMNCSYCTYKRHLKHYLINNEIPFLE